MSSISAVPELPAAPEKQLRPLATPPDPASQVSLRRLVVLLDFLLLACMAALLCFWEVGAGSFTVPDEVLEVAAGQELFSAGPWHLPTLEPLRSFDKPMFKLWLSEVTAWSLGASNFSYRFVEALSAVIALLLVFLLAETLFHSRAVAWWSIFGLAGCDIFLAHRGIRTTVQDSWLLLWTALVMLAVWKLAESLRRSHPGRFSAVRITWFVLASLGTLQLALYAYGSLVRGKQQGGVSELYVLRLFVDGSILPVALVLAATLYGAFRAFMPSATVLQWRYLLGWMLVPLVLYGMEKSRLSVLVTPAVPAMALLIGALLESIGWLFAREARRLTIRFSASSLVRLLMALTVLTYAGTTMGLRFYHTMAGVQQPKARIPMDEVTDYLLGLNRPLRILTVGLANFAHHERPYINMLKPFLRSAVAEEVQPGAQDVVLAGPESAAEILRRVPASAYRVLPPLYDRGQWMAVLLFHDGPVPDDFIAARSVYGFAGDTVETLYGFGPSAMLEQLPVRWQVGSRAALVLQGDAMLRRLGAWIYVNLAGQPLRPGERIEATVALNGFPFAKVVTDTHTLSTHELEAPPEIWNSEKNVLSFQVTTDPPRPIIADERPLLHHWLSIRLNQPGGRVSEAADTTAEPIS
ncbi:MAG: hypothetical protein KDD69_02345 [Bdellovibrionales bacterium]|nr:hypothetical protein [Bdellovibrionales bacterium]